MIFVRKATFIVGLVIPLTVILVVAPLVFADEEKKGDDSHQAKAAETKSESKNPSSPFVDLLKQKLAEKKAADKKRAAEREVENEMHRKDAIKSFKKTFDSFAIPDGTPDELFQYLETLAYNDRIEGQRLQAQGLDTYVKFITKRNKKLGIAFIKGAEKILESHEVTEKQFNKAVRIKMIGIDLLYRGHEVAASVEILRAFPEQLEKLKKPEQARVIKAGVLRNNFTRELFGGSHGKKIDDAIKEIEVFIGDKGDEVSAGLVINVLQNLENHVVPYDELTLRVCQMYSKPLLRNNDPVVARRGRILQGIIRRLNMVGKPMTIVGTTVDGSEFHWNDYQGKAVLVLFWEASFEPGYETITKTLTLYKRYHDKGLEVVGIGMDEDVMALKDHIAQASLPWTVIHDGARKEGAKYPEWPNATYYGIIRAPKVILVGRDGNVISTTLNGCLVNREVEKLFEPAEKKEDASNQAAPQKSTSEEKQGKQ